MVLNRRIIFVAAFLIGLAQVAPAKTAKRRPSVRPVQMYTLQGCERCASLKRYLRREGVHLDVTQVDEHYMSLYPTVFYSDDSYDHGSRILNGRCRLPETLEVIETE